MTRWVDEVVRVARNTARDADALLPRLRERPTDVVVNVHSYAWAAHEAYLHRYHGDGRPRIVALSMNPGRNGAVQTGIPFCDAPQARELLSDFDALVPDRPRRLRSEAPEMSGRKLRAWAEGSFGTLRGLYDRILFVIAIPVAVLRGPILLNVPLPNLRGRARAAADAFYEEHAPQLVRAARPTGLLILGDYAARRWQRVLETAPDLRSVPARATHHPAARITNGKKFTDWTRAVESLSAPRGSPIAAAAARP